MKKENQKRWRLAWAAAFSFHAALCLLLAAAGPLLFPAPEPPVIEVDLLGGSADGGSDAASAPSTGAQTLLTVRSSDAETAPDRQREETGRGAVRSAEEMAAGENGSGHGDGDGAGSGRGSGTGDGTGQDGTGNGNGGNESNDSAIEPPQLRFAPETVYPEDARRRGAEGTVTVGLLIAADGSVAETWVEASSGDEALDEAALEAVRRWRFAPARQNGGPVSARSRVPVVFALHE